jgi:hypothetical protein
MLKYPLPPSLKFLYPSISGYVKLLLCSFFCSSGSELYLIPFCESSEPFDVNLPVLSNAGSPTYTKEELTIIYVVLTQHVMSRKLSENFLLQNCTVSKKNICTKRVLMSSGERLFSANQNLNKVRAET